MPTKIDIPIDDFLSKVNKRNTARDGSLIDPNLERRMSHPTCVACKARYREKYPGRPFEPVCQGIYSQADFEEEQAQLAAEFPDDPIPPIESNTGPDIREIYDRAWWSTKHIVVKDDDGIVVPFEPRDYQEEMLNCTARHKVDRCGRGMGKALALDTPIPTPAGWTTMGELRVGDQVFDETGSPCTVTFATEIQYDRTCYEVVFSDGSVITADEDHLWETWDKLARKTFDRKDRKASPRTKNVPQVRTTGEIKATLYTKTAKPEANHSIPVTGPLEYLEKPVPLDPYVLGLWLGDGSSDGGILWTEDHEILGSCQEAGFSVHPSSREFGYSIGNGPRKTNSLGQFSANGSLISQVKSLGLYKNKHVPDLYLRGSVSQRLALLQGLMDTDGSIDLNGWAEFVNTNRRLADAVFELATSLGMKVSWGEKDPICSNNGAQGAHAYRVGFFPTLPVFRIRRKLARIKPVTRPTVKRRFITDVRPTASVPVRCIQVDSPNRLYLAGKACIPTHNTTIGVIIELHAVCNQENYEDLVICPQDSQSEKWWNELLFQLDNSPSLKNILLTKKQQPFRLFKFNNGSTISIFTAGSSSGRGANSIRSQSPRRIRIDEQDFLADGDWDAIGALINRYRKSEFHGSSTPTGARGKFYDMCTQLPRYREFYYPITRHPDWNEEMELNCRMEAKTEERFQHEWLAEFGDPAQGLFKNHFVDLAKTFYKDPLHPHLKGYATCQPRPGFEYFMGVDWNGKGTGTRIRVVEYDPKSGRVRAVDKRTVDHPGFTVFDSIDAIAQMNRKWNCRDIYIDAGYGHAQGDMLIEYGKKSPDPIDKALMHRTIVDFGATLSFNALRPNRDPRKPPAKEELDRPTKPFMVEGAVMRFEQQLIEFSDDDVLLDEQLRAYRVKTYSQHGWANTYHAPGSIGDHDLDAFMLALLAIEIRYGFYATQQGYRKLAQISHSAGFGIPETCSPAFSDTIVNEGDLVRTASGVPSRQLKSEREAYRIAYLARGSAIVAPTPQNRSTGRVPSRTAAFRNPLAPNYGRRSVPRDRR